MNYSSERSLSSVIHTRAGTQELMVPRRGQFYLMEGKRTTSWSYLFLGPRIRDDDVMGNSFMRKLDKQ